MNRVIFIVIYCFILVESRNNHRVKTDYGHVKGRRMTTIGNNKTYYSFQGIPYAKPPLGDLRFAAPVPPKKWSNFLDATKMRSSCIEMYEPQGTEDCLYLNVYTPAVNGSFPVIIFIHGGAFVFVYGNFTMDGVDYFMEENVVFVTVQYRLGIFGFLSTEDSVIPGNFGLKDQLMATEWVHKNIHAFGGNSSKITLMGQSAGAVSTGYLGMVKKLEGKISGIIQQSGSTLVPFGLSRYSRLGAYVLGTSLGVQTTDSKLLLDELRKKNAEELRKASLSTHINIAFGGGTFHSLLYIPVREPHGYKDAVFTKMAYEELKTGNFVKVPRLIGINSFEALFMRNEFTSFKKYYRNYDENIRRYVPYDMHSISEIAAKSIKNYYFGNSSFTTSMSNMIHFASDDQFIRPILKDVSLTSGFSPIYLYHFSYEGKLGNNNRTIKGVEHGEELEYLFHGKHQRKLSDKDKKMRKILVKLWSNFAKHGNPTPYKEDLFDDKIWLPVNPDSDETNCFDIGEMPNLILNPHQKDFQFWERLYADHGNRPYDTY